MSDARFYPTLPLTIMLTVLFFSARLGCILLRSLGHVCISQIHQLSFSPHTDAKGIMDLVKFLSPKHVILVHGEKPKMAALKEKIQSELSIECSYPANNETMHLPSSHHVEAAASDAFLKSCLSPNFKFSRTKSSSPDTPPSLQVYDDRVAQGLLTLQPDNQSHPRVVVTENELSVGNHQVKFVHCCLVTYSSGSVPEESTLLRLLYEELRRDFPDCIMHDGERRVQVGSSFFASSLCSRAECRIDGLHFCCTWSAADDEIARKIISVMENNIKLGP